MWQQLESLGSPVHILDSWGEGLQVVYLTNLHLLFSSSLKCVVEDKYT